MRDNMVGGRSRERSPSPVKSNIFLARDQAKQSGRDEERGRSGRRVSPGRAVPRTESPSKPFQSRQPSPIKTAVQPVRPTFGSGESAPAGPPKPSRTFQAAPVEREEHPTDTLQAKSVDQKRSMFEGNAIP